jgi:hypothetical protein
MYCNVHMYMHVLCFENVCILGRVLDRCFRMLSEGGLGREGSFFGVFVVYIRMGMY